MPGHIGHERLIASAVVIAATALLVVLALTSWRASADAAPEQGIVMSPPASPSPSATEPATGPVVDPTAEPTVDPATEPAPAPAPAPAPVYPVEIEHDDVDSDSVDDDDLEPDDDIDD